jgi:hypothetical protein
MVQSTVDTVLPVVVELVVWVVPPVAEEVLLQAAHGSAAATTAPRIVRGCFAMAPLTILDPARA